MSPAQFVTLCVGGILALTPLSIYLVWLAHANRQQHPLVVSATWEFAGLISGLSGLLFCTGVVISAVCMELALLAGGTLGRIVCRLPILVIYLGPMLVMLALLGRAIRRSLHARRNSLAVFNLSESHLPDAVDRALTCTGIDAIRRGYCWYTTGSCVVQADYFPAFRHCMVRLNVPDAGQQQSLERELRTRLTRLPAAQNPAAVWISAAATCCVIAVGCCVLIVFAIPFL